MEFTKNEILEFGSRLSSLGGRLGFEKSPSDRYIDIEEFFLDATRFVFVDERIARCIENWVRVYGFLISPSKLKRLIEKDGYPFDPAVLGVFLTIISQTNQKQLNLTSLWDYCKSKDQLTPRIDFEVRVRPQDYDPVWIKFNIATHKFIDESKKNLINPKYTLKNTPELRNRIESDDILCADYKAFIEREGRGYSLNYICQKIHGHYSNLHKIHNRFEKFGVYSKLVKSA